MEKVHFDQAKLWLDAAQYTADCNKSQCHAVALAMLIHAVIKANDSLTFKFKQVTARKHDDAKYLFEKLVSENLIGAQYAQYKNIIQDVIQEKARVEYRGSYVSKADYESMLRKAQKFISMAAGIV